LSQEVDYEAELVVVIGRTTRHVAVKDALKCVAGYTCGHDVSARDWQKGRPGGQWLLGKSFDTFGPIGPWLVTTDEIPDPSNLRVRMHLSGEVVQDSTTRQLIFDIPQLISHLSKIMTLKAGDLIFTGTPPGVGMAKTPPRFLRHGDVCTVEIEGIGPLTNPCVAEASLD
jgi:2-keto-4-pentenoate hydratase/2-oxohepta-3-ene-1,7-dioic acid hydratase in catechol pathway